MKRQQFKSIAQGNIDEIDKRVEDLIHQFEKKGDLTPEQELLIEQLEQGKNALIEQYNNLDTILQENWDNAMRSFTTTRNILRSKFFNIANKAAQYTAQP